jgi:nicotinate-nucleotide pyrophosphorylase (carboxylating)
VEEALEAAAAGSDIIMLDNFNSDAAVSGSSIIKEKFPNVIIEVSGGITMETIHNYMCPSIDILSMGSLTQGYDCVDYSLKVQINP